MRSARVVALAGRRIDASDATTSVFPLSSVDTVRRAVAALLAEDLDSVLVCSAACGADLLALREAARLSIRCRVILPFSPSKFRTTSVIDRPGNWGELFDAVIERARYNDDLVVLEDTADNETAFTRATRAIIAQSLTFRATSRLAVIVWEGHERSDADFTAEFAEFTSAVGFVRREILI